MLVLLSLLLKLIGNLVSKKQPPGKRAPQQETRLKLLTSGAAAFARSGVGGARITEIAREAGIAVGTFYLYFDDKTALYKEVMQQGTKQIIALLLDESDRDTQDALDTDRQRNIRAMTKVVEFARGNADLFRLLLSRGAPNDPLQRQLVDLIAQVRCEQLEKGKKTGRFFVNIHPEITARGEIGFVYHALDWWLSNPDKVSIDELIEALVDVRMFGVETRRPDELPLF